MSYQCQPGETVEQTNPCACDRCMQAMEAGECNHADHCWCGPEILTIAGVEAQVVIHRDPKAEAQ